MPRPLRIQEAGLVLHVFSRGNDGRTLFPSNDDHQKYIELLELARQQFPVRIYNYALLENCIHLMVEPEEDGALSKFMQIVTKEYAKYFNKKYDRRGHVFEGRYKSVLIQKERYFFTLSRYIDLCPVEKGLVKEPQQHPWSGHARLVSGKKSALTLDSAPLYKQLGKDAKERQIAYRTLVFNYQGEGIDFEARRSGILGDREFKKEVRSKNAAKKQEIKKKGQE